MERQMNMTQLGFSALRLELSTDKVLMLADFGGLTYGTDEGFFVELTVQGAESP
jgi:hypothetical protein